MKTLLGCSMVVGLGVTLQAETPQAPAPRFQLLVFNFAGLSNEMLVRSMRETARIFRQGGVEMDWIHCPPYSSEGPTQPTPCQFVRDVPQFQLRLLSASADKILIPDPERHGFALFTDGGEPSSTVYVFADRATKFTENQKSRRARVLGYLISHELGHLLLGLRGHSVAGIMHVPWRGEELKMVFQGSMCFHPAETRRIRSRLRELADESQKEVIPRTAANS